MCICAANKIASRGHKKRLSVWRLKNVADMGIVNFLFISSLCKVLFIYIVVVFLELSKYQRVYYIGVIICTILKYKLSKKSTPLLMFKCVVLQNHTQLLIMN